MIAYLNLDEVIRIIRNEDEPKPVMIARFNLTDVQAEAILNMRLRSLRKLEEIEIKTEHGKLSEERKALIELLGSDDKQWDRISAEIRDVKKRFGKGTPNGKRKTEFASLPQIDVSVEDALIEKEPVTIVLSEKGWIRALKGHEADLSKLSFKTDDTLKYAIKAQTTDKLVLFATNGKFYTLDVNAPSGRSRPGRTGAADDRFRRGRRHPGRALFTSPGGSCWWPRRSATALSCPRRKSSPRRARASRS